VIGAVFPAGLARGEGLESFPDAFLISITEPLQLVTKKSINISLAVGSHHSYLSCMVMRSQLCAPSAMSLSKPR